MTSSDGSSSCSSSSTMSTSSTDVVQRSLFAFLESRGQKVHEDVIDDIVLSYVVSIVEELSASDISDRDESAFDLEALVEMLEAYLPQTKGIPPAEITMWMFSVAEELQSRETRERKIEFDLKSVIEETTAAAKSKARTPKTSESVSSETDGDSGKTGGRRRIDSSRLSETSDGSEGGSLDGEDFQQTIRHMQEMFPYSCSLEVNHCLQLVGGDVERAAQLIMFRHEAGQSLKPSDRKLYKASRADYDDKSVKDRILGKYGFVDQDEDARYHRPMIKKADEKKLIRYRDGKIVSTKGERFTQVSKEESEEMKKALVNISLY